MKILNKIFESKNIIIKIIRPLLLCVIAAVGILYIMVDYVFQIES
jgi:hypothetical protein